MDTTINNKFSDEIRKEIILLNNDFKNKINDIFTNHTGKNLKVSVYQNTVNTYNIEEFIFTFCGNRERNEIAIDFPKITTRHGVFLINNKTKEIYSFFLNINFNHSVFNDSICNLISKYINDYQKIATDSFEKIRDSFFSNSNFELDKHERNYFDKPKVLIKCLETVKTSSYGYKAGEGSNFIHETNIEVIDVFDYDDLQIQKYLGLLNNTNPSSIFREYRELQSQECFADYEYYALDLSSNINRYIKIFEDDPNRTVDYSVIGTDLKVTKNLYNDRTFIVFIVSYVLIKFDLKTILIFLNIIYPMEFKNQICDYQKIITLSDFFLKWGNYEQNYRKDNYKKNFENKIESLYEGVSCQNILTAFFKINGSTEDLNLIIYYYINYFKKNLSNYDIDHTSVIHTFNRYFCCR